jgi:hypothetical protein
MTAGLDPARPPVGSIGVTDFRCISRLPSLSSLGWEASMSGRVRRLRDKAGYAKHVRLHRWLLRSAAWASLSLVARCTLVELYDLFNGENNGEIFLGAREAATRLSVGKNRALAGLHELEARGFIRARQRGSFSWKSGKATQWILTEFSFAGQAPTKDFMKWTDAEKQNAVPVSSTDGPFLGDRFTLPKTKASLPEGPLESISVGARSSLQGHR